MRYERIPKEFDLEKVVMRVQMEKKKKTLENQFKIPYFANSF
jgi:hypothetical protein